MIKKLAFYRIYEYNVFEKLNHKYGVVKMRIGLKNSENFIDVAALTAAKKRHGSENMEASEIRKPP